MYFRVNLPSPRIAMMKIIRLILDEGNFPQCNFPPGSFYYTIDIFLGMMTLILIIGSIYIQGDQSYCPPLENKDADKLVRK